MTAQTRRFLAVALIGIASAGAAMAQSVLPIPGTPPAAAAPGSDVRPTLPPSDRRAGGSAARQITPMSAESERPRIDDSVKRRDRAARRAMQGICRGC